ncbi:hypothetical protein SPFM20_00214 [Salmonella phage SPFM20]|nr:hypothetical protein SPFM20_00214 [Salmonella phage SPFM20]
MNIACPACGKINEVDGWTCSGCNRNHVATVPRTHRVVALLKEDTPAPKQSKAPVVARLDADWEAHVNAELRKFHAMSHEEENQDGLGQKIQRWFTVDGIKVENVVQWGRANLKFVTAEACYLTYPTFNYTPISDTQKDAKGDEAMALFEGNTVFAALTTKIQQLEGFHCPRLEAAKVMATITDSKKRIAVLQGINRFLDENRKTSMYSAISRALCVVLVEGQSYGLSSYDLEQQESDPLTDAAIVQLDRDKRRTYITDFIKSSDFPLPFDHEVLAIP